jgi:hypothetical protein
MYIIPQMNKDTSCLSMFTVYHNPWDYPGKYVVRRHAVSRHGSVPREVVAVADTLEEARRPLRHLHCLGREPGDESQIVETWI